MKASELRALTAQELETKLRALKIELAKERAVIASGTRPEKPTKIRNTRKDIARILTILNQKRISGEIAETPEVAAAVKEEKKEIVAKTKEVARKGPKVHKLHKHEKAAAKKEKKQKKKEVKKSVKKKGVKK